MLPPEQTARQWPVISVSGHKTYPESYLSNKSGYILELLDLHTRQKWNTAGIRRQ